MVNNSFLHDFFVLRNAMADNFLLTGLLKKHFAELFSFTIKLYLGFLFANPKYTNSPTIDVYRSIFESYRFDVKWQHNHNRTNFLINRDTKKRQKNMF